MSNPSINIFGTNNATSGGNQGNNFFQNPSNSNQNNPFSSNNQTGTNQQANKNLFGGQSTGGNQGLNLFNNQNKN